eukprot:GILK01012121.1.p1 GENE.GILK01012121.1~~GILK01012121.1.p1  ORF type:complete len:833 (-),score=170.87 GILK01012121.1:115-2508(-)
MGEQRCKRQALDEQLRAAREKRAADQEAQRAKLHAAYVHAKAIALQKKEKESEHLQSRRRTLANLLASAEQRRNELLEDTRCRAASHVRHAKEVQERQKCIEAFVHRRGARLLCRWWRSMLTNKHTSKSLVESYLKNGLTLSMCSDQSATFDSIKHKLLKRTVMTETQRLLSRLESKLSQLSYVFKEGKVNTSLKKHTRVFLAAFMIRFTSESEDGTEAPVESCAKSMLEAFHILISDISLNRPAYSSLNRFYQSWLRFVLEFFSWKDQDAEQLASELIQMYAELETRLTVKGKDSTEWTQGVSEQMANLKLEAKRLVGEEACAVLLTQARSQLLDRVAAWQSAEEQSRARRVKSENEKLVHAMLMDDTIQVRVEPTSSTHPTPSLHETVAATAEKAFWDSLVDSLLQTPPDCRQLFSMLHELQTSLEQFTPRRSDLIFELRQKLDLEGVHQSMSMGPCRFEPLQQILFAIISRIRDLESPARNEATDSWMNQLRGDLYFLTEIASPVESFKAAVTFLPSIFKFIYSKLSQINADLITYRLQTVQPIIRSRGIEYERQNFREKLENGELTLNRTDSWLKAVMIQLTAESPSVGLDLIHVLRAGVVQLLTQPNVFTEELCPETLLLDVERLVVLQRQVGVCIRIAIYAMLVKQILAANGVTVSAESTVELKDQLEVLLTSSDSTPSHISDQLVAFAGKHLQHQVPPRTLTLSDSDMLRTLVAKSDSEDVVFRAVSSRVSSLLIQFMSDHDRLQTTRAIAWPLDLIEKNVREVSQHIARLARYNLNVYESFYQQILKHV